MGWTIYEGKTAMSEGSKSGYCPVCNREVLITEAGKVVEHYRHKAFLKGRRNSWEVPCGGSGIIIRV